MFSKRNVVTVIKLLAFFIALLSIYRHLILMNELNEEIIELPMWLFTKAAANYFSSSSHIKLIE